MSIKTKKKKKKREQKIKLHRHHKSVRDAYNKKYPSLIVEGRYANIDLINEVKQICQSVDFRMCFPNDVLTMLHDHKKTSSNRFMKKYSLKSVLPENKKDEDDFGFESEVQENHCNYAPYIFLEEIVLLVIYTKLKESGSWNKFMPIHHIGVSSYRGDFKIYVDGFHQHHSEFGKGYYTEKPLYIDIPNEETGELKKYRVAISMHALERIFERGYHGALEGDLAKAQYPMAMHQFMFLNEVRLVKMSQGKEWGIAVYSTFKQGPESDRSLPHKLAFEILHRMKGFKLLCGYCPIGFCKDEFIHLKTLLSPGMRGTPEESLILSIEDKKEQKRCQNLISENQFTDDHIELYKFFQSSGYHVIEYFNEE